MITTSAIRRGRLWLGLCLVMAGLQFLRGAYVEAAIFVVVPSILTLDAAGLLGRMPDRGRPARPALAVGAVIIGLPLAAAPRYSALLAVLIGGVGLIVVIMAWPGLRAPRIPTAAAPVGRGRVAWAASCILACAFEVGAYLLSRVAPGAELDFPAVSDLVGPLLDTDPGRLVFAAAWVAGGAALLRRGGHTDRPPTAAVR